MSDEATIAIEETSDRRVARSRLTIDLATSYALSLARVAAWAIVSTLIVRAAGLNTLALVALVRGTMNLLGYVPASLTPPLVHANLPTPLMIAAPTASSFEAGDPLEYVQAVQTARSVSQNEGGSLAFAIAGMVCLVSSVYSGLMWRVHSRPNTEWQSQSAENLAILIGVAIALRIVGEPAAARLQASGRLWVDNVAQIVGEIVWITAVLRRHPADYNAPLTIDSVGVGLMLGQLACFGVRKIADLAAAGRALSTGIPSLLAAVATLYVGQLADYLYGSSNQILIDRFLGRALAAYVPCLQIDGALLLIVSGIGVALFPRVARHTRDRAFASVRRDYVVGTLVSLAMLVLAALAAWLLAPFAIRHWLGVVPAGTLAILPLVLVHTVIGGTAGIGRAVLLGMGRFSAYTISALVGGVANVLLALLFVLGFGWGLRGIVCATIVAVVGRRAIWMPWYILRALR